MCSQEEFPTASTIQALDGKNHVVAQTRSGANGKYSMTLPAGHYTLHAVVNPSIDCDADIDVHAGGTLTTQIECDEYLS